MRKRKIFFIIITALILLFSCGIPNAYVPNSSDITITKDSSSGTFTVALSDTVRNELRDSSPTLYFFYTISSGDQDSAYKSLRNTFDTNFASETSGSIITSENPICDYTSGEKQYSLYQLTREGSTFNYLMGNEVSSETLTLSYDTSENTLTLSDSSGTTLYSGIQRVGDKIFTQAASTSDIVDYTAGSYTVNIYLVVSCSFTSYNNIYNTKIYNTDPILSFHMD